MRLSSLFYCPIMNISGRVDIAWTDIFTSGHLSVVRASPFWCFALNGWVFMYATALGPSGTFTVGNGQEVGKHSLNLPGVMRCNTAIDITDRRSNIAFDHNPNGNVTSYLTSQYGTNASASSTGIYGYRIDFPVSYLSSSVRAKYGI